MKRRHSRRALLGGIASGTLAATLGQRFLHAEETTIRIGLSLPMSGSQADNGETVRAGAEIAADQVNAAGGILGRKLELVIRDDKANPNGALAVYKELAGSGINLFLGGIFTTTVLPVLPELPRDNTVYLAAGASTMSLTHELFVPNFFRTAPDAYMNYRGQALVMAQRYPNLTSWVMIATDAAFGHDIYSAFSSGVKEFYPKLAGKSADVLEPIWVKPDQSDFRNQIISAMATPAQGIFFAGVGAQAVTLYGQGRALNWESKFQVINDAGLELGIGKAMGANTPKTIWSLTPWSSEGTKDNPVSQYLTKAYVARTKDPLPRGFVEHGYTPISVLAAAVGLAGSSETKAVIAALETGKFQSPNGPYSFRKEDHQALTSIGYVCLGPKDAAPGWAVVDYATVAAADAIEPPAPGQPFKF